MRTNHTERNKELTTILENINTPEDLQKYSEAELKQLAKEIRQKIIATVAVNGGHLASNLGVVELTLVLHRVFKSPSDALVWDVGHQCYTHKLLTGRREKFATLRTKGGLSGFTKRRESEHDFFDAGHSSTSISSALGLLAGRRLQKDNGHVVAIIGDGSLTGGMAFEALSHAGQMNKNLIVVLNDNQMSISRNTGSLSKYLSKLTTTASYQSFRYKIDRLVDRIPFFNKMLTDFIFRFKRGLKGLFFNNNLFVDFGFEYVGPLNGHNISELETVFKRVKQLNKPVVVHVLTKKGHGYSPAENDPMFFHGIGPFSVVDGTVEKSDSMSFTEAFSKSIVKLGGQNEKIACITAAMAKGTGLTAFAERFPDRFFDVGIAEQHAITFAGGLAASGLKPVAAVYSTFMQRAADQVVHDIALQNAGVILVLDRSGPVPDDGETHQGLFDIAFFRSVPNMTILAPASAAELDVLLQWAAGTDCPVIIRYPKTSCPAEQNIFYSPVEKGRGVFVSRSENARVLFVCTGGMYGEVLEACRLLGLQGVPCDIYNLRFIKPVDEEYFLSAAAQYETVVFAEDGVRLGGVSEFLENLVNRRFPKIKTALCAFPDRFFEQGKRSDILEAAGLSPAQLARTAL